ncbi:MAG: DUF475 domain-containing protein [Rhodococcus sp.]|nr:DUF475 domain-containing protein [Rhodococcus sp. (in: high G+C Gram-positive bacteria)]
MSARMRSFGSVASVPVALLAAGSAAAWWFGGWPAAAALITLAMLEIALAADSAVPMAGLAGRLHNVTRRFFLAVGLTLGVVAMRLGATPVAVATVNGERVGDSVTEIFGSSAAFGDHLDAARPALAGFGAVFVWLVFADYLMNVERKNRPLWIAPLEVSLYRLRRPRAVQLLSALVGVNFSVAVAPADAQLGVAAAGVAGIVVFYLVKLTARHCAPPNKGIGRAIAHAATVIFERALIVFMMFEILDGAYTFTGPTEGLSFWAKVAIAFAGIGIGAVFLSRLTSALDRAGAMAALRFLPAGVAYVLGVLALLLWISVVTLIPPVVTAWFGTAVIAAALVTSYLPRIPGETAPARSRPIQE